MSQMIYLWVERKHCRFLRIYIVRKLHYKKQNKKNLYILTKFIHLGDARSTYYFQESEIVTEWVFCVCLKSKR